MRFLVFLVSLLAPVLGFAESGTTGAPVLQRVLTSRGAGMGGAFVAGPASPDALDYNPGSAAGMARPLFSSSYLRGFENSFYASLSGFWPLKHVVLMGRVVHYNGGDITVTQSTGETFKATAARDSVYSFGIAGKPFPSLEVGGVFKLISLSLVERFSDTTYAGDLGARWRSPFPGVSIGAAVQNLGRGVTFGTERDPLPSTWRIGASAGREFFDLRRVPGSERLDKLDMLVTGDVVQVRDGDPSFHLGVELGMHMPTLGRADVRLGHVFGKDVEGIGFGLGFREEAWQLDYSLGTVRDLSTRHQATLSFWFGRVPEKDWPIN